MFTVIHVDVREARHYFAKHGTYLLQKRVNDISKEFAIAETCTEPILCSLCVWLFHLLMEVGLNEHYSSSMEKYGYKA